MKAKGVDGTISSHPIGLNGHGAGPLMGLWDYQDGVPGRGDAKVIPSMWFSIEPQATTPAPEWGGQAGLQSVAARMVAAAPQRGDLLCVLAVLAAVFPEFAFLGDRAVAGGVRTLRWSHGVLLRAIVAPEAHGWSR
jgi:hypothetical protein